MISLKAKIKNFFLKLNNKDFSRGISTIIGASILNFLVGAIFSLCTLSVYEISYIKAKGGSISIDHLTFYYPIEIIFQYVSAFVSGKIYKEMGLHLTNLIGVTILTLGYFIMFISSSLFLDLLSMIIGGIGTGIILYPSTINAYEWFIDHNGAIVGILETSISLGSFFFAFIGEKIINKDEIQSNDEDNLYDFEIGKKIKLYLIIQMITLDSAFILSYFLMHEKKNEDDMLLIDIEDNTHIVRFDAITDIGNISHVDLKQSININTNLKKNEGFDKTDSDKENEDTNETIHKASTDEKSENNINDNTNKNDSENEKKEEPIEILKKGELKNNQEEKIIEKEEIKKDIKEEKEKRNENKEIKENKEEQKKEEEIKEDLKEDNNEIIKNNFNIEKKDEIIKINNKEKENDINSKKKEENINNDEEIDIKDEKEKPLLINEDENETDNENKIKEKDIKKMLKLALKSKRLILFSIIVILQAPVANMAFSLYREIGEYKKMDLKYLQLIGSLYFIFECFSSFVFGILCDFIQLKYLLFFINGVGTLVGFIYCLTFKSSLIFFLVQNFLSFSAGGYYPVKDCYLMKVFGKDIYIELSGYVSFLVALSVNLLTPITYFVQSGLEEKDTAYWILFLSFGSLNLIGLILNFFLKETPIDFENFEKNS